MQGEGPVIHRRKRLWITIRAIFWLDRAKINVGFVFAVALLINGSCINGY